MYVAHTYQAMCWHSQFWYLDISFWCSGIPLSIFRFPPQCYDIVPPMLWHQVRSSTTQVSSVCILLLSTPLYAMLWYMPLLFCCAMPEYGICQQPKPISKHCQQHLDIQHTTHWTYSLISFTISSCWIVIFVPYHSTISNVISHNIASLV